MIYCVMQGNVYHQDILLLTYLLSGYTAVTQGNQIALSELEKCSFYQNRLESGFRAFAGKNEFD